MAREFVFKLFLSSYKSYPAQVLKKMQYFTDYFIPFNKL